MATYRCPSCARWRFDLVHLRACLPKSKWAQELEQWPAPEPQVERKALVYKAPEDVDNQTIYVEDDPLTCECGFVARNAQALALHRRKARQHQEAVTRV